MNAEADSPENLPIAELSTIKVAIIYEDFTSGTRARHFAERLAAGLDGHCPLAESMWRDELLGIPAIAEEATRSAAHCDYLIVSLRGDRLLSPSTRQWIEAHLDDASQRANALIILADSYHGKWRIVDGTRHYLRTLCNSRGVPFFSHAMTPPRGEMKPRHGTASTPALLTLRAMPTALDA